MRAFTKTGPKRRRATRRETWPVSRYGWVCEAPRYRRAAAKRQFEQQQREGAVTR